MAHLEEVYNHGPNAEDFARLEGDCSILHLAPLETESGKRGVSSAKVIGSLELFTAGFSAQGGRFMTLPRQSGRSNGLVAIYMDEVKVPSWYPVEIGAANRSRDDRPEVSLKDGRLGPLLSRAAKSGELGLFGHSPGSEAVLLPAHPSFSADVKCVGGGIIGLGLVVPSRLTRAQHLGCVIPFIQAIEFAGTGAVDRVDLSEVALEAWATTRDDELVNEMLALVEVFKAGFLAPGAPRSAALKRGNIAFELAAIGPRPRWVY